MAMDVLFKAAVTVLHCSLGKRPQAFQIVSVLMGQVLRKRLWQVRVGYTHVEPSQEWLILPGPGESLLASLRLEAGQTGGNEHIASAAVSCESTQTDS